jgi:hypothetical protein
MVVANLGELVSNTKSPARWRGLRFSHGTETVIVLYEVAPRQSVPVGSAQPGDAPA